MKRLSFLVTLFLFTMGSINTAFSQDTQVNCLFPKGEVLDSIIIKGLTHTKPQVIYREISNRVGQSFDCGLQEQEIKNLEGLDLFSKVNYSRPAPGILEINVKQLPSWLAIPSTKKTDQDGLILGPGLVFFDLFGLDYRYDFYARSSVSPLFKANEILTFLESPWLGNYPIYNALAFTHIRSYNSLKLYDETSYNFFAQGCYRTTSKNLKDSWCIGGKLEYLAVKQVDSARIFPNFENDNEQLAGYEHTGKLGLYGWRDTREKKSDPHWGDYSEVLISKAGLGILSSADYWEFILDHRFWYEWIPKTVFHGNILNRNRIGNVPKYEYYHAGGANSIRGFLPDTARWASEELLATAEIRYDIIPKGPFSMWGTNGLFGLQAVVGYDYLLHHQGFDNLENYSSVYLGTHLLLAGLDRIRFEIGVNPMDQTPVFTLGFFEKSSTQRFSVR